MIAPGPVHCFSITFTIDWYGGHLGHVIQMPRTNFRSPYPRRFQIKFGFDRASGFGEEDVWNCLRRTDGRRRRTAFGSGELIQSPSFQIPKTSLGPHIRVLKTSDETAEIGRLFHTGIVLGNNEFFRASL